LNRSTCLQSGLSCGFNFESDVKNVSLVLIIEDSGSPMMLKEFRIDIIIMDANDPPVDIKLNKTNVNENEPSNTLIGNITVVDEDFSDRFTCSQVSAVKFYVDPNLALRTADIFNFESQSAYEIILECFDSYNISIIKVKFFSSYAYTFKLLNYSRMCL